MFPTAPAGLLLALLLTAPAAAQDARPIAADTSKSLVSTSSLEEVAPKSRSTALAIAALGTAIPAMAGWMLIESEDSENAGGFLLPAAVVFGPSFGQMYAGSHGAAWGGITLRALGGVFLAIGLAESLEGSMCSSGGIIGSFISAGTHDEGYDDCPDGNPEPYYLAGGLLFAIGTGYSLLDTPRAVERHNRRARTAALGWTPTLSRAGDGRYRTGALAYFRF